MFGSSKFQPGDRVRFNGHESELGGLAYYPAVETGATGTVVGYDFDGPRVEIDGLTNKSFDGAFSSYDEELELVA